MLDILNPIFGFFILICLNCTSRWGIAGASSIWMLKKQYINFIVLENQSYTNGLACILIWIGFYCDFAAHHLFTTDDMILKEMLKLVPMNGIFAEVVFSRTTILSSVN